MPAYGERAGPRPRIRSTCRRRSLRVADEAVAVAALLFKTRKSTDEVKAPMCRPSPSCAGTVI
jgi:hypothetical protein